MSRHGIETPDGTDLVEVWRRLPFWARLWLGCAAVYALVWTAVTP